MGKSLGPLKLKIKAQNGGLISEIGDDSSGNSDISHSTNDFASRSSPVKVSTTEEAGVTSESCNSGSSNEVAPSTPVLALKVKSPISSRGRGSNGRSRGRGGRGAVARSVSTTPASSPAPSLTDDQKQHETKKSGGRGRGRGRPPKVRISVGGQEEAVESGSSQENSPATTPISRPHPKLKIIAPKQPQTPTSSQINDEVSNSKEVEVTSSKDKVVVSDNKENYVRTEAEGGNMVWIKADPSVSDIKNEHSSEVEYFCFLI